MDDNSVKELFAQRISQINEICLKDLSINHFNGIDERLKDLLKLLPNLNKGFLVDGSFVASLNSVSEVSEPVLISTEPNYLLPCLTNCYRLCRNLCATCTHNQDVIRCAEPFIATTHKVMLSVIQTVSLEAEEMLVLLRCAIQFLGNYSSGNKQNQLQIWETFRHIFRCLLQLGDVKLQEYVLMVVHLCLGDIASSFDVRQLDDTCWDLMLNAIMLAAEKESAKGLLVIEDAFKMPGFCENVFKKMTDSSKSLVLEVMINCLNRLPEETSEVKEEPMVEDGDVETGDDSTTDAGDIPALCNVQFIAADFIVQAHHIPMMNSQSSSESQALCTVKELECLCLASSHHKIYSCLQELQQLIRVTISLLQSIEDIGRQGKNVFTNVDKISQQREIDTDHPVFGLKRDLIRLLGNLAYKHRANQDLIRELNGIPLILDQTNIDGKNPFITQWSVFAIHNLTEENEDNRLFIAQLKMEGVANNQAVLEEMGLSAEKQGDKVVIKKQRKQ